jgi:DNA-binding LytR/AlgR family response regulator
MPFLSAATQPPSPAGSTLAWKVGLVTWAIFIVAMCAYCLLHQAFVRDVTPDLGRTLIVALQEWGVWALIGPWVLKYLADDARGRRWGRLARDGALVALIAALVPVAFDTIAQVRDLTASLALFWPRNLAAVAIVYLVWRVFLREQAEQRSAPRAVPLTQDAPGERTLLVSRGASQCLIRLDEVQAVSAAGNYIEILARDQRFLMRATMVQMNSQLPASHFVRIHRSHIIRIDEIAGIRTQRSGAGTVQLRCGRTLPISKRYRAALVQRHGAAFSSPHHTSD